MLNSISIDPDVHLGDDHVIRPDFKLIRTVKGNIVKLPRTFRHSWHPVIFTLKHVLSEPVTRVGIIPRLELDCGHPDFILPDRPIVIPRKVNFVI